MTQHSETLESLRDHYRDAVNRGDESRAMDVARTYRKITDRLITEDAEPVESWIEYHNRRFHEMMATPRSELI